VGKVNGSVVECPHISRRGQGTSLITVANWNGGEDQTDRLGYLDSNISSKSTNALNDIAQTVFSFNLIEHVSRKHGSAVFGSAVTTVDRVIWLKANIGRYTVNWYGYGSSPLGSKAYLAKWDASALTWSNSVSNHTQSTVNKLSSQSSNTTVFIDANGFIHFLAYADASDGTTASTVYTDYIDLDVELNVQTVPATGYSSVDYKPYTLDYVLSSPVEEIISNSEGMISLASGGSQIELFEGVIVREKVTPRVSGDGTTYGINHYGYTFFTVNSSPFNYRAATIINVYKNGNIDPLWTKMTNASNAYGTARATIKAADYDSTAEYTVTYNILDKYLYTTNIIDVSLSYQGSQKSVVDTLVQKIADDETKVSIHAMQIVNIIARMKAAGI
jgi:hypothetical protein